MEGNSCDVRLPCHPGLIPKQPVVFGLSVHTSLEKTVRLQLVQALLIRRTRRARYPLTTGLAVMVHELAHAGHIRAGDLRRTTHMPHGGVAREDLRPESAVHGRRAASHDAKSLGG